MMHIIVILSVVVCINSASSSIDIGNLANSVCRAAVSAEMFDVSLIASEEIEETDFFAKLLSNELIVKIETWNSSKVVGHRRKSSIILVKNLSSIDVVENFAVDGKVIVVVLTSLELTDTNIARLFGKFWQSFIANVNLVLLRDKIRMMTFLPFSNGSCHNVEPKIINNFNGDSWSSDKVFTNKFRNFNKCPFKLASYESPPGVMVHANDTHSGFEIELIRLIAKLMNATLVVEICTEQFPWGFLHENGSAGGVLKQTLDGKTDISIGNFYLTATRAKYLSFCVYMNEKVVLTIPQGIPLSSFEKLLSPYAFDTWTALILTLATTLLLIFVVRRQHKLVRDFIFGVNTGNPYINLVEIILSGSQVKSPKNNFSRTMLMCFILFCIVMRTLYQSGLFKFLQSDQRHPQVQTIDELVEKKFDVYMYESFTELSQGLKIHPRRKYVGNRTISFFMQKTLDPHNKLATVGPLSEVLYENQKNYKNFTYKILPEILFSVPVALYLPKHHFMVSEMSTRINSIESVGLTKFYVSKYLTVVKEDTATPLRKLNLDHLSSGFVLYLVGCSFGIVALAIEVSIKRLMDVMVLNFK